MTFTTFCITDLEIRTPTRIITIGDIGKSYKNIHNSIRIKIAQSKKVSTELIAAIISGSIGAFAGLSRALSNFNQKLDKRFEIVERDIDSLHERVIRDYVLKEDLLREMQAVHTKLDRIFDHLLSHS